MARGPEGGAAKREAAKRGALRSARDVDGRALRDASSITDFGERVRAPASSRRSPAEPQRGAVRFSRGNGWEEVLRSILPQRHRAWW